MSSETRIAVVAATPAAQAQQGPQRAPHERDIRWMLYAGGLAPKSRIVPTIAFLSTGVGAFSLLWNPTYYLLQPVFWSAHIMMMVPAFLYLWRKRQLLHAYVGIPIQPSYRWITLIFYGFYMLYWAYFSYLEISERHADPWYKQIGHVFMSFVWYIFFAASSAIYYYTATLLLQRTAALKQHVHAITEQTTKEAFFTAYEAEYEANRRIANSWNLIILLVILVLTLNLPADLLGILVNGKFITIPGLIIKSMGLVWYLLTICKLNYMETYVLNYLQKHHILQDSYEEITRYMEVRRLGLNFFGLRITYELLMKVAILGLNVVLPILYGLFSEHILHLNFGGSASPTAKNETLVMT